MGLLDGVRVVDMSRVVAGPFAAMQLCDLGADVIKIEGPGEEDPTRRQVPQYGKGISGYFFSLNRNKRSLVVNLKVERGKMILRDLVKGADVLLENFRPGTLDRLGMSIESLHKINPRLVICSITGFDPEGAYRDKPAFDGVIQAISGVMMMTGEPGSDRPTRIPYPVADLGAGLYSALGILAALYRVQKHGVGEHLRLTLFDTQMALFIYKISEYYLSGEVPRPTGAAHESAVPYDAFKTADGTYLLVAAQFTQFWPKFCSVLGIPELVNDDRFSTRERRRCNREELTRILQNIFKKIPSHEWLAKFDKEGVPAAPVNTLEQALKDPEVQNRNMLWAENTVAQGEAVAYKSPFKISGNDPIYRRPPRFGEHTVEILESLGYRKETIDHLIADNIVVAENKR
jgi:CoA:oxalate CoA-transferase